MSNDKEIVGYYNDDNNKSTDPMECDHDYITLRMEVGYSHGHGASYGDFCDNCNARLDGIYGIIHYNQKFKYQEIKKKNDKTE